MIMLENKSANLFTLTMPSFEKKEDFEYKKIKKNNLADNH